MRRGGGVLEAVRFRGVNPLRSVESAGPLTFTPVGQGATKNLTNRTEDMPGNSLVGPQSSKKSCEGATARLYTARKTPHKHKHAKAETKEARRKEREANKLAKKAKEAMKAEKRMVKKQKRLKKEAACEPCRMH